MESIFEALSACAALHPDELDTDDDMGEDMDDDAFVDADVEAFQPVTGEGDQELSESGRVRSDFVNNNRFAPY